MTTASRSPKAPDRNIISKVASIVLCISGTGEQRNMPPDVIPLNVMGYPTVIIFSENIPPIFPLTVTILPSSTLLMVSLVMDCPTHSGSMDDETADTFPKLFIKNMLVPV